MREEIMNQDEQKPSGNRLVTIEEVARDMANSFNEAFKDFSPEEKAEALNALSRSMFMESVLAG